MSYRMLAIAKREIDALGGSDLLREIPNTVYRLVSFCYPVPGQANIVAIFFDLSLADQYGKLSPASKNWTTNAGLCVETLEQLGEDGFAAIVRRFAQEAVQELGKGIRGEPSKAMTVHIAENARFPLLTEEKTFNVPRELETTRQLAD